MSAIPLEESPPPLLSRPKKSIRIRVRFLAGLLAGASLLAYALNWEKQKSLNALSHQYLKSIGRVHEELRTDFQQSFYFNYEDQFKPKVQESIRKVPNLVMVRFLTSEGGVLYDSATGERNLKPRVQTTDTPPAIVELENFQVRFRVPSGSYQIQYVFSATELIRSVVLKFLLGLGLWAGLLASFVHYRHKLGQWFGLRAKFILTILLIHSFTGVVMIVSLSRFQLEEESDRLKREAAAFSRFTTQKILQDYSDYYYFYFQEKFLPKIKELISSHRDLMGVKIVSASDKSVLFDSESPSVPESKRIELEPEMLDSLRSTGSSLRNVERADQSLLSVWVYYEGGRYENSYYLEFIFSQDRIEKTASSIRNQIWMDLLPSLAVGILIALAFSQWLVGPIRALVSALREVSQDNYEVNLHSDRSDEMGEVLRAFNGMTSELKKRSELRKFLSESTYQRISSSVEAGKGRTLKGVRVHATVLFSDIRDFVQICDTLDAEQVTSLLNDYFTEMVAVINRHHGEIDKFIGDAILAVFYDQESSEKSSTSIRALYCALEMQERMKRFNQQLKSQGRPCLETGIGITSGEIISGPIGSKDRMDFTVIGDAVNIANRIEKLSKIGKHTKILFTGSVLERIQGLLDFEELPDTPIAGKTKTPHVYELIRIRELKDLLRALQSKDGETRKQCAVLLGLSGNSQAAEHLLKAFRSEPSPDVRLAIIESMVRLGSKGSVLQKVTEHLLDSLSSEKDERVLASLISALGKLSTGRELLALREFLNHTNERIAANAIQAIGKSSDPATSDLILEKLSSSHHRIKANAAVALFQRGQVGVIDTLKPMLLHSDPQMRSSAAYAIGELTSVVDPADLIERLKPTRKDFSLLLGQIQECVPMLVSLLKDADKSVKRQAIVALGKIRDQSAVLPILSSVDFKNDSKEQVQDVLDALRQIGTHKLVREVIELLGNA